MAKKKPSTKKPKLPKWVGEGVITIVGTSPLVPAPPVRIDHTCTCFRK